MRSALFYIPVWIFSLGALCLGAARGARELSAVYVGLGGLGISVANALMLQHRRISELERKAAPARSRSIDA